MIPLPVPKLPFVIRKKKGESLEPLELFNYVAPKRDTDPLPLWIHGVRVSLSVCVCVPLFP